MMPLVLLTGAKGHVGGRVLEVLEQDGRHVRRLTPRRAEALAAEVAQTTQVVGDAVGRALADAT